MKNYPHIDILFFERPLTDLKRFAFKIAKELKKEDKNLELGSVSLELPGENEGLEIKHCFLRDQIYDIDEFLKKCGVQLIVFSNHRVPDMEFILHARKNNIKTVLLQEGIIFRGQNINEISFSYIVMALKFLPKVISYLNILRRMCRYDGRSFMSVIVKMLKYRTDITNTVSKSYSVPLVCDYVFTMGNYWNDYYIKTAGYREDQIYLIGSHDLDSFTPGEVKENAICYIATVLAEDGTVSEKRFFEFVNTLADAVDPSEKLYIKLHPRSDKKLYTPLRAHNVTFVGAEALPSVNVYIGHSSTLMGRALYESDQLILYRFPEEKENFYEKFATAVCTDAQSLKNAVLAADLSSTTNRKRKDIEQVYWQNPKGAIKTASEYLYEYVTEGKIVSREKS